MLTRDFLTQMANAHELTPEQEHVFLLRFSEGKGYEEIAQQLATSPGACLKRMGQVYLKFSIPGECRGKENRLRIWLLNQFQQTQSSLAAYSPHATSTHERAIASSSEAIALSDSSENSVSDELIGGSPPKIVLQNLPHRDSSHFVGRQVEIARLLALLSPNHSAHLISIDGIGGVGKTTLALEVAHCCLHRNVDSPNVAIPIFEAIIFTSAKHQHLTALGLLPRLNPARTLQDIFRAIAQTLNHPEISSFPLGEQLDLIRVILSQQRTLLIIDNLETIEDKQDVLSFVYDLPLTVKVILTTREQALFVPIRLESLPREDGLHLISRESQEKGVTLSETDALALYQGTAGVPAAIIYTVGQLAAGYPLSDVLAKVKSATGDVARFCFSGAVERFRGQPPHRLLMALSLFPKSVLRETLAQITFPAPDPILTIEGLARLQQLSLVRQQQGRYSLHPLTREYALAELMGHPEIEEEVRSQWVQWYLKFSEAYGATDWKEWHLGYDHLEEEWENLQTVIEWCAAKIYYEKFYRFWRQIKGYAHIKGYWNDRLHWSEWLIQEAERRGDWAIAAEALADRGWTLTQMGQPKYLQEANGLLKRAWSLRTHQDLTHQLDIATSLVILCIRQQQLDEAQQWLHEEEDLLKQVDLSDQERQRQWIHIRYYQAEICFRQAKLSQAKVLYQQALDQARSVNWQRAAVAIQNWLAEVALEEGKLDEAQQWLEQGLPVAEHHRDQRSIAFHKRSFAYLEKRRGNLTQARHWATAALEGFETLRMLPEVQETQALLQSLMN